MADPLILDIHTVFGPVPPRGVAEEGTAPLLSLMSRHGVAGAVALSTRGIYHSAAAGNRETAALCQASGGVLLPAAVLDPRQPDAAAHIPPGTRLLCLMPATQNWPARFAPLTALLRGLTERGLKLSLFWEVSRLGDATAAREALDASGYAGAVVFGGAGGDTLTEAVTVAQVTGTISLCTNGLRGVGEVAYAVTALGASRVVFGSGAPALRTLGGSLRLVRMAGLSEPDAEQVLGGNAKRLLAAGGTAT